MPDLNENATSDVRIACQLGTLRLAYIREVINRYGFAAPSRREAEGSAVRARAWCGRRRSRVSGCRGPRRRVKSCRAALPGCRRPGPRRRNLFGLIIIE